MIRNILFDLDGTLFNFDKCEEEALKSALKRYDKDLSVNQLNAYKEINSKMWNLFEKGLIDKESIFIERFIEFLNQINLDVSPSQFNKLYMYFLGNNYYLELGALETLTELICKYKLYIVTNGKKNVQLKRMLSADLIRFFDYIFIAEDIGVSKPTNEYFNYCFDKMNCTASSCMIIGDSISSDILGGKNVNMVTCWYNPNKRLNSTSIIPDFEIDSLEKISRILEKCNGIYN